MAITPISNVLGVNRNYSVNFGTGKYSQDDREEFMPRSGSSSNLVKVPVIVLLAMSPLNSSSVDLYNQDANINAIEIVQTPQQSRKPSIKNTQELTLGNQHIIIVTGNRDSNVNNFERVSFSYDYTNEQHISKLRGVFFAIADKPESDGKYLIAYKELHKDGKLSNNKICYFPKNFGSYVDLLSTSYTNNKAILSLPKSEFIEYFGNEAVKNAPMLKDATTSYELMAQEKD